MSKLVQVDRFMSNPPAYPKRTHTPRPVSKNHPAHLSHPPKFMGFGRPAQSRAGQS